MSLIFGVRGPNNGEESGIYSLDNENIEKLATSIFKFITPDCKFTEQRYNHFPKFIYQNDNGLFTFYDKTIQTLTVDNGNITYDKSSPSKDLTDLVNDLPDEFESRTKPIKKSKPESLMVDMISNSNGEDLYISFYIANKLKFKINEGFLLYSKSGNIEDLTILFPKKLTPTGKIFISEDVQESKNIFHMVSKNKLLNFSHENNFKEIRHRNKEMPGNILTADHNKDFTVCTDNLLNYLIIDKNNRTKKYYSSDVDENIFFIDGSEKYLEDVATSVKIVKHKNQNYLIFGMNRGILKIYKLNSGNNRDPEVEFYNRIYFLSQKSVIMQQGKDNYIHNMSYDEDTLNFTLRDLYLSFGIDTILSKDLSGKTEEVCLAQDKLEEERRKVKDKEGWKEYKNKEFIFFRWFQRECGVKKIHLLPHRISAIYQGRG
ncbi:MAG: hypothetical protein ABIG93_05340 [archaeon]